jgi:uncharacterized membrane protein YqgA involved in biofilm formation
MLVHLNRTQKSILMLKSNLTRQISIVVTCFATTAIGMSSIQIATAATTSITAPSQIAPSATKVAKKKKGSAIKKGDTMKKADAMRNGDAMKKP